jgi:hypothetical protein
MKRITISLPDDLAAALERESRREHRSVSEIARKAIEVRLGRESRNGRFRVPFASLGRSKPGGPTARDIEEFLREEWTIDRHRG